jgi:hypothetical protein
MPRGVPYAAQSALELANPRILRHPNRSVTFAPYARGLQNLVLPESFRIKEVNLLTKWLMGLLK